MCVSFTSSVGPAIYSDYINAADAINECISLCRFLHIYNMCIYIDIKACAFFWRPTIDRILHFAQHNLMNCFIVVVKLLSINYYRLTLLVPYISDAVSYVKYMI